MARRYDSADAKRRILAASAKLFLEKGYTNTKLAEILKAADVSASSFQNIFRSKDGVLTEFVGIIFGGQFGMARELTAGSRLRRRDGASAGADGDEREPARCFVEAYTMQFELPHTN